MNYLDIILVIFILFGLFKGLRNGFLLELSSFVGLIAGIYGAIHFSYYAVEVLSQWVDWDEKVVSLVAFAVTFLIIIMVVSLLARALTQVVNLVMLGLVNKLLGALFGFLKSVFVLSVLLMFLNAYGGNKLFLTDELKEESEFYSWVAPIAPAFLPDILRELERYEEYL